MSLVARIRDIDAYPKTLEDFQVKTTFGGGVTLVAGVCMFLLFLSELNYYLTVEVDAALFVDTSRHQKLRINMDIFLPSMPCIYVSVDAMDASGEHQTDVAHNIVKQRYNKAGFIVEDAEVKASKENATLKDLDPDRCESCYGAEDANTKCCNTCEQVREAYKRRGWKLDIENVAQCQRSGFVEDMKRQQEEGCRVSGHLEVSKVAGNFHLAPGKSFQQHHVHVHDLQQFGTMQFNLTHHIHRLSFGESYPGISNPLDGQTIVAEQSSLMHQYFVKVVPTVYARLRGEVVRTNQFSFTKHVRSVRQITGEQGVPGIFFLYDFSPLMVEYTERRRSFMHFLTAVCAIVGGVFTVAGIFDSLIYYASRHIRRKIQLAVLSGKQ